MDSTIEVIRQAADRLYQLTDDPHPGLSTWHEFLEKRVREIVRAYYGEEGLAAAEAAARKAGER
jgi:uncharacterized membrane-anchored protein